MPGPKREIAASNEEQNAKKKRYFNRFDEEYYRSGGYEDYLKYHEHIAEEEIVGPLFSELAPQPDWTFLDVGSGLGGTILALRKRGFACFGTEISPYALAHAPAHAREWMRFGESTSLPFDDASFDVILCCNVFEYLTRDEVLHTIREFGRVARKFITIWVFDPHSTGWSQTSNPDPLRREDTRNITADEFIAMFAAEGITLSDRSLLDLEDVPDWRLTFRARAQK